MPEKPLTDKPLTGTPLAETPPRERLAVVIPAYGRAATIASTLAEAGSFVRDRSLPIGFHVSDDTPDASVEDAVAALAAAGHAVRYRRNTPPLRHDRNIVASLLWPDADHVWPLGSSLRIEPDRLAGILDMLDGQDLLLLESHADDARMLPSVSGDAARALLRDKLWHQTMTGATIYGPRVRDWVRARGEALTVLRNFPQISVMAGFASQEPDLRIGWFGQRCVAMSPGTEPSYWRDRAVEVFAYDWAAAVSAFPKLVPPADRARVIREHSRRSALFSTAMLLDARRSGQFTWSSLRRASFRHAMHEPLWKLLAVLALPSPVARAGMAVMGRLKRSPRGQAPG